MIDQGSQIPHEKERVAGRLQNNLLRERHGLGRILEMERFHRQLVHLCGLRRLQIKVDGGNLDRFQGFKERVGLLDLVVPVCSDEEDVMEGDQLGHEPEARGVGPLDIVEDEDDLDVLERLDDALEDSRESLLGLLPEQLLDLVLLPVDGLELRENVHEHLAAASLSPKQLGDPLFPLGDGILVLVRKDVVQDLREGLDDGRVRGGLVLIVLSLAKEAVLLENVLPDNVDQARLPGSGASRDVAASDEVRRRAPGVRVLLEKLLALPVNAGDLVQLEVPPVNLVRGDLEERVASDLFPELEPGFFVV